ncbi:MAG: hypothetical protein UT21_C0009G0008 [Candidatus Woesebacteria bacterium GW2011_GWA1_39_11b]|nr:MAG: hypothetical protein UT21_C0009G0008 [Candidatus Woesebacteria bacterium GW2011_GWA1_39_11b]KKS76865.1 MAG: hypothetical protein UV51_C0014G0006 [Candidatus Woesebacteria bacterium GW2011_GWC1_42_9]
MLYKFLGRHIRYILFFLPLLWLAALAASFAEAYFYPGVLLKHTSIDALFFYLAFGIAGLSGLYGDKWKEQPLRLFRKINYYAIYVFGLGYFTFYLLEKTHYPNYVFSTFHIHPLELGTPLGLSIFAIIISSKDVLLMIQKNLGILYKWFPIVVIFSWILVKSFIDIGTSAARDVSFIINNPTASYDQKMEVKLGKKFYDYVLFVKKNTPEDSKILIPPFPTWPWAQSGNIPYMTYFLYPRTLLNGEEYSPKYDLNKEDIDFVLLAWGELDAPVGGQTNGWPKFDVRAEKIIYMINEGRSIEIEEDYVYKRVENRQVWGLIKVKK